MSRARSISYWKAQLIKRRWRGVNLRVREFRDASRVALPTRSSPSSILPEHCNRGTIFLRKHHHFQIWMTRRKRQNWNQATRSNAARKYDTSVFYCFGIIKVSQLILCREPGANESRRMFEKLLNATIIPLIIGSFYRCNNDRMFPADTTLGKRWIKARFKSAVLRSEYRRRGARVAGVEEDTREEEEED